MQGNVFAVYAFLDSVNNAQNNEEEIKKIVNSFFHKVGYLGILGCKLPRPLISRFFFFLKEHGVMMHLDSSRITFVSSNAVRSSLIRLSIHAEESKIMYVDIDLVCTDILLERKQNSLSDLDRFLDFADTFYYVYREPANLDAASLLSAPLTETLWHVVNGQKH